MFENLDKKVSNEAPYETEKMSSEEAWNKTYNLLSSIYSHFEKFNGLKKTESSSGGSGFYARYSAAKVGDDAVLDKAQQFLVDQKLIKMGLEKLEQEIHKNTETLASSSKASS